MTTMKSITLNELEKVILTVSKCCLLSEEVAVLANAQKKGKITRDTDWEEMLGIYKQYNELAEAEVIYVKNSA